MELSDRQLKIISFIYNNPNGIKGKQLASLFSMSLRTIQNEIKTINKVLHSGFGIKTKHSGYYIPRLHKDDKLYIASHLKERVSIIMPVDKVLEATTILMFEKDYISMEEISYRMNISKSSVFNLFQNSVVLQRCSEISRTKGIRIKFSEVEIRNELSKIFDLEIANSINPNIAKDYIEIYQVVSKIIDEYFLKDRQIISSEELWYFKRHIVISAIRNKYNFHLNSIVDNYNDPLIINLSKVIEDNFKISLSDNDMYNCSQTLLGLSSFSLDEHFNYELFDKFIATLKNDYGLNILMSDLSKKQFNQHINKLLIRSKNNQYNKNFHKREINRRFPMTCLLIVDVFEKIYQIELPDTEVSLLALYLAREIYREENKINCLLVCEDSPSIAYNLQEQLKKEFSFIFSSVDLITDYQYPLYKDKYNNYILLTTSQSFSILEERSILIDYFLNPQNITRITEKASALLHLIKTKQFMLSENKYLRKNITVDKEYDSIKAFLKDFELFKPDRKYEFVTDIQVLLFPLLSEEKSYIDIYTFNHSITYQNKRVKKIIFSNYDKKEMNIVKFHEYLTYKMNS